MKMKEDKNEKKCIKKVKNPESGKDCLPKNCTGDDGRLVIGKKAKKNKKVDLLVINTEKESWVVGDEKEEKKKRFVPESMSDADGADVNNENDKKVIKKKKKKELDYGGNQVEIAQDSVKEVEGKKHRKEKKVKNKSAQLQSENVQIDEEDEEEEEQLVEKDKVSKNAKMEEKKTLVDSMEMTQGQLEKKKKKKKKKKKTIEKETTETTDGINVKKNNNSKARMNDVENEAKSEIAEGETREVKKDKKKRRKKEGGNEVDTPQVNDSKLSGKKDDSTENVTAIVEEEMAPKKKKKKGKKLKGEEEPLSLKPEDVEEQKRETLVKVALDTKRRKRKEMSTKEETQVDNVSFEHGARKKIRGQMEGHNESAQLDVDLLSGKSGNTEVAINQERRLSDQTSQPQKTATPTGLGQWSTAQFKSSDEQQKFLRLMGGFKKGFQPAAGNIGRANMALGKDAQQQLQRGLQGEFERAHSRRLDLSNRGAGLGFTAPSNKKFSIDINECRSVRFDD